VTRTIADFLAWAATATLVLSIAWPYATRRRSREVLRPHFWAGYFLAPLATAHGWAAMKSGQAHGASMWGTSLASLALLPLVAQIFVGKALERSREERRQRIRRGHFVMMTVIAILIAAHLALVRW
jgi:hypothetical protein